MIKLLADDSLPLLPPLLSSSFELKTYQRPEEISGAQCEILLCRSTLKVNQDLLQNTCFKTIATASSGTDHIDVNYLQKNKITLLDAKGSNAAAVADYVLATLAYLNVSFKTVGIIGMGAVGRCVSHRLSLMNKSVLAYDPWLPEFNKTHLEDILACDVISIHANLQDNLPYPSRNLLDLNCLQRLKPGTVLINAARGELVDENALLRLKPDIIYCTDVYHKEPNISSELIDYATICTPHIAGHSIEAKLGAMIQISQQLHQHYQLTMPRNQEDCRQSYSVNYHNWQKSLLAHYNPIEETLLLKQAPDKTNAYLSLRRAHNKRHDIDWVNSPLIPEYS